MPITIDIENASGNEDVPEPSRVRCWLTAALKSAKDDAEVSVRIVDEKEMSALNGQYRNKHSPTNVLSFPANLPPELGLTLLGDIVLCASVIEREALEQHKTPAAHWAHMFVHGILHLLGYDHISDKDAEQMENFETRIIIGLGFPPPYEVTDRTKEIINHD